MISGVSYLQIHTTRFLSAKLFHSKRKTKKTVLQKITIYADCNKNIQIYKVDKYKTSAQVTGFFHSEGVSFRVYSRDDLEIQGHDTEFR